MKHNQMTLPQAHKLLLSPPGDTLLETLEHKGISPAAFAERLGKPLDFVMEIIQGKASISEPIAQQLEKELGISAQFWLERERRYQLELHKP
jgi:HTH-type transcriptional regulator / antitoxin HigA